MTAEESGGDGGGSAGRSPNLLTHIVTTICNQQRENTATAALLYVMETDREAGRAVVADLAQRAGLIIDVDLPKDLYFVGQDPGDSGRPDAVGSDGSNRRRVVIEAKIEAGFQPEQVGRYSKLLAPDMPCVIVVLAPERRLPRLLEEANGQLARAGRVLVEVSPTKWQSGDHLTLLGISWTDTLAAMEKETSSPNIDQLRVFYDYLDKAVFLPFSGADLAAANGRLMWSITSVAQNVAQLFPEAERTKTKHDWPSVGQSLKLHGRRAWFGVWLERWARQADTPYWLTYHKNVLPTAQAVPLLPALNAIRGIAADHDGDHLCIALLPPVETDRGIVERELFNLIRQADDVVANGTP